MTRPGSRDAHAAAARAPYPGEVVELLPTPRERAFGAVDHVAHLACVDDRKYHSAVHASASYDTPAEAAISVNPMFVASDQSLISRLISRLRLVVPLRQPGMVEALDAALARLSLGGAGLPLPGWSCGWACPRGESRAASWSRTTRSRSRRSSTMASVQGLHVARQGTSRQEHQPEDDVLVLVRRQRTTQLVGRLPQRVLEL